MIGPAIAGTTAKLQAANVVSQELTQGAPELGYFQVPHDHAAMHNAVIEARKTFKLVIRQARSRARACR